MSLRGATVRTLASECVALVRSQRLATGLTAVVVAMGAVAVMLTAGRAAILEADVLSTVDAQGTRTIAVRAQGDETGLTTSLLAPLLQLSTVESAVALGEVRDVHASALEGGRVVGLQTAYGRVGNELLRGGQESLLGSPVLVSRPASAELGLEALPNTLEDSNGQTYLATNLLTVPDFLTGSEPLALEPQDIPTTPAPIRSVLLVVRAAPDVERTSALLRTLLTDVERDKVTVETPAELARLRSALSGELRAGSRSLVLGALAAAAILTGATTLGHTLSRRRDFGRRRALGASRSSIVALVMGHVLLAATAGALAGVAVSTAWLRTRTGQYPDVGFTAPLVIALVASAMFASGLPAVLAARRDPVRELRVP